MRAVYRAVTDGLVMVRTRKKPSTVSWTIFLLYRNRLPRTIEVLAARPISLARSMSAEVPRSKAAISIGLALLNACARMAAAERGT